MEHPGAKEQEVDAGDDGDSPEVHEDGPDAEHTRKNGGRQRGQGVLNDRECEIAAGLPTRPDRKSLGMNPDECALQRKMDDHGGGEPDAERDLKWDTDPGQDRREHDVEDSYRSSRDCETKSLSKSTGATGVDRVRRCLQPWSRSNHGRAA